MATYVSKLPRVFAQAVRFSSNNAQPGLSSSERDAYRLVIDVLAKQESSAKSGDLLSIMRRDFGAALGVVAAIAGAVFYSYQTVRNDFRRLEDKIDMRFDEIGKRFDRIDERFKS